MIIHGPEHFSIKLPSCRERAFRNFGVGGVKLKARNRYMEEENRMREMTKCEQHIWGARCAVIGCRSPVAARRLCESLGIYFRREFSYDFRPYIAEPKRIGPNDAYQRLFLWIFEDDGRVHAYGVVSFRFAEFVGGKFGWELDWAWFHPYQRGQGNLTVAWPYFLEAFPGFWVSQPLSFGMESFLKKVGYDKVLQKRIEEAQARKKSEVDSISSPVR